MRILYVLLFSLNAISLYSQDVNSYTDFNSYDSTTTLRLSSYIYDETYDCGEWGGHEETLVIYKSNGVIRITYSRAKNNCEIYFKGKSELPPDIRTNYSNTLKITDWHLVKEYVNGLVQHKPDKYLYSNAPNSFTVEFTKNNVTSDFKIDDHDNSWKKYEIFRNYFVNK